MSANPTTPVLNSVRRLLGLSRPSDDSRVGAVVSSVRQFDVASSERDRVRSIINGNEERVQALTAKLKEVDGKRIDALTDAQLGNAPREAADALLGECSGLRQEISDARAVVERMRDRLREIEGEFDRIRDVYRRDVGIFLTDLYSRLIADYNAKAPQLAQTVVGLGAVTRVMRLYGAGNSNGWTGEILLPGMKAGDGRTIQPILDGASRAYEQAALEKMDEVLAELRAAGFTWRLD